MIDIMHWESGYLPQSVYLNIVFKMSVTSILLCFVIKCFLGSM